MMIMDMSSLESFKLSMSTANTGIFVGFALCIKALVPENIGKD